MALLTVLCLTRFVAVGVMISTLFSRYPNSIGRLYCTDLLGAGVGCALAVPSIAWVGPPVAIMLAAWTLAPTAVLVGGAREAHGRAQRTPLEALGRRLGAFTPLCLSAVARSSIYEDEYVAWAWAVTGSFPVIGSVLTTILSRVLGFDTVLLLGLGAYCAAALVLLSLTVARQPL